jgi:hypothetical protein
MAVEKTKKGLIAVEWATLVYTLITTIFILVTYVRLTHPTEMLWFRAQAVVLTLAAMLIMLFLLVLFMSLIQQIFIFISTVYTELSYRAKV